MSEQQTKFHCAGYYSSAAVNPTATESSPRALMRYEICLFLTDSGTACLNGHEYIIHKNSLMVRKPGDVIRWTKLHFVCRYVHFTVSDPAVLPLLDALPPFTQLADGAETESHMLRLFKLYKTRGNFVHLALLGRLYEFLWHIYTTCGASNTSPTYDPCRPAIRMIHQNYRQGLSVETLAKACNLSPSYFHKQFLRSTGTTPNRYITLTRLNAAKAMLRRGSHPIEEIAVLCGFSSQSYLCDCMKKYTGMSPRQYQRSHKDELEEI